MIGNITTTVSETLDAPVETIRVLVTEIPKTHWGKLERPMSEKQIKFNQMNKVLLKNKT